MIYKDAHQDVSSIARAPPINETVRTVEHASTLMTNC
jgi:hypothetical protein